MRVEVDQSGKIADTQVPTILAFSNDITYSILISTITKRKLVQQLRKSYYPRNFYLRLFAVLLFILLKSKVKNMQSVFIDKEYWGREEIIKSYILDMFKNMGCKDPPIIDFALIGKKSNAHYIAINAFRNKKANKVVSFSEIMRFFPKKKDRGPNRKG